MLGIVFDVDKLVQSVSVQRLDEVHYLRNLLREKDEHIKQLEDIILRHVGVIRPETPQTAQGFGPTATLTNWRDQRKLFESKFRPPEYKAREEEWRKEAEEQGKELGNVV